MIENPNDLIFFEGNKELHFSFCFDHSSDFRHLYFAYYDKLEKRENPTARLLNTFGGGDIRFTSILFDEKNQQLFFIANKSIYSLRSSDFSLINVVKIEFPYIRLTKFIPGTTVISFYYSNNCFGLFDYSKQKAIYSSHQSWTDIIPSRCPTEEFIFTRNLRASIIYRISLTTLVKEQIASFSGTLFKHCVVINPKMIIILASDKGFFIDGLKKQLIFIFDYTSPTIPRNNNTISERLQCLIRCKGDNEFILLDKQFIQKKFQIKYHKFDSIIPDSIDRRTNKCFTYILKRVEKWHFNINEAYIKQNPDYDGKCIRLVHRVPRGSKNIRKIIYSK